MARIEYPFLPDMGDKREAHQEGIEPEDDQLILEAEDNPPSDIEMKEGKTFQNAQFNQYANWPFPAMEVDQDIAIIYDAVRSRGLPNHKGAKIPLPSPLNPEAWEREATGHPDDGWLSDGVKYGFPIQYTGGPTYEKQMDYNHTSAHAYDAHVRKHFKTETESMAMAGPYTAPPFTPWYRASPIMTRPKAEEGKRRIIVDLSFPEGGVNAYIHPHTYHGKDAVHSLPIVNNLLQILQEVGTGDTRLAVVDISRAYRHFPTCPLDWPLLVLQYDNKYYFDRATPFGARMSSYIMQSAASFIVRALESRGIRSLMYLDDLILISQADTVEREYQEAINLLISLALEVAAHKLQPPSRQVVWLGIKIDLEENIISIPPKKLSEIQQGLALASRQQSLTRRALQRVVGQINHLGKVVTPARLFMGRLLAALRGAGRKRMKVNRSMKADFAWFRRFLKDFNGKAIIPQTKSRREIWADACLQGGGATDGDRCYSFTFPQDMQAAHHITHLEAINCLAAARTLALPKDKGNVVLIHCDNQSAVEAYKGGRAEDPVLNACARAIWFLGAQRQVEYEFNHVPGKLMDVPDALSRVMVSSKYERLAEEYINELDLEPIRITRNAFSFSSFFF